MFNIVKKSIQWGGKELSIETGKIARQADGAVVVTYGDTQVLCAVTAAKEANPEQDFFPLSVHYQTKTYAAGKIPGGFFKREAKPSEFDTLTSRLIDRPIRPMFEDGFKNEVQIVCTVISHDKETQGDIPALIGASAALAISGVPFLEAIAAARVGYKDGEFTLNPTHSEVPEGDLELMVAGTKSSVLMVESEASGLDEATMLGAVEFGHQQFQPVIELINELAAEAGKPAWELAAKPDESELESALEKLVAADLRAAYAITAKQERVAAVKECKAKAQELMTEETSENKVMGLFKDLEKSIVRGDILSKQTRIDGRKPADVRQIEAEVGLLPKAHGSALFTRGETQALVVATLGTGQDEQILDNIEGESKENFMLHYNFPPYSVGECGRMGPPGRREIGHGKLAWRAVKCMVPNKEDFPYTIRLVSEITESNGSSSMASVCGSSMAMMDAGVPIPHPIAGIAMGLIKEGDDFVVLSDIMGDEDHLGDMDFKVAGTEQGITSLQMDIKINGITFEIMKTALSQAKDGRLHILGEMAKGIKEAGELNDNAPRIIAFSVPVDKIGAVIGSGGSVIKGICEDFDVKVDIEEDGTVRIGAATGEAGEAAKEFVMNLVTDPEVGNIFEATVDKVLDFGFVAKFMGAKDGLVHVSQMAQERVEKVTDMVNEGDTVWIKIIEIERGGKLRLSMKAVNQENGEDLDPENGIGKASARPSKPRGDRGDRGGRDRKRAS